jgi:bifunctional non-homologous end joining protein LigD
MQFLQQPMTLIRRAQPFSHSDWLFEIKHDGFRALAYLKAGQCQLVSRKRYTYSRFEKLTEQIASSLSVQSAVLDGEIVCLDEKGKSQFKLLMYRRGEPYFYAFDLLQLNGKDLRSMPHARKHELKRLIPEQPSAILYVDHVEAQGERLFHVACREDLEGIVAKLRNNTYDCQRATSWIKIKNPAYTQIVGRQELFEKKKPAGNLNRGRESNSMAM